MPRLFGLRFRFLTQKWPIFAPTLTNMLSTQSATCMLEAGSVPGLTPHRDNRNCWEELLSAKHPPIQTAERKLFILRLFSADQYQRINSGEHAAAEKKNHKRRIFSCCSACWVTSGEDVDPHPCFLPHVCKLGLFGWLEMICIMLGAGRTL